MLSRVEEFEQIYILDSLPVGKIRASPKALAELEEMNRRSINSNPILWKQTNENLIKIASMNSMNLFNNYDDIISDQTIMESTIIVLSETWLEEKDIIHINGYESHLNSIGPGKGLALYFKKEFGNPGTTDIKKEKIQITKLTFEQLDLIAVYRSELGNLTEMLEHLENLINFDKWTVVCGDFNICYTTNRKNKVTQWLEKNEFTQLMKESTHIRGRLIDHFYHRPIGNTPQVPSVYRYTPYYSDHDATCITFTKTGL